MRFTDDHLKATYGSRAKYVRVLERNLADRSADTYEEYLDRSESMVAAGFDTFSREAWEAAQAASLAEIRAQIAENC